MFSNITGFSVFVTFPRCLRLHSELDQGTDVFKNKQTSFLCWQPPHFVVPGELRSAVLWCCGKGIGLLGAAVAASPFLQSATLALHS